jgi:hypothetical protein
VTRHLLIIGGQRCGTTLLYELLDGHPEIAMAKPRRPEPKVFLSDELSSQGIDWYHSTFFGHATDEVVYGEKSTSYIEDPDASTRAAAMLGAATIVVQLRDPVTRAVSNWRFSTRHGAEDRTLVQALTENLAGPRAWDPTVTSVSPFAYLERGRYSDYLDPWRIAFPGSLHIQFLEDDPGSDDSRERLYRAVGVDPSFRPVDPGRRVNASDGVAPELPADLVLDLRRFFHDSDERLTALVGRPLPWASR